MDRLACVDVAALPLQLLLREHPDWAAWPAAVVEDDRPQASVLFLNTHARRLGVRSGHRYATALTLAHNLHAGTMSPSQIEQGVGILADRLRRYSPHVEPASDMPGVFWLDASGLGHLYPSLHAWADLIRADLQSWGMKSAIAVGFSRFGVYALATSQRGTLITTDATEERTRVHRVPLARLNLDPDARDRLLALGITTIGDFLRLPGNDIRTRFGTAAATLHQLASGARWSPLVPVPADIHHRTVIEFDAPESNVERLLFVIKRMLDTLATRVSRLDEVIVEVVLWMKLDDRSARTETVKPAVSTLDVAQLLTLVRLRLETLQLSSGIGTMRVAVSTCRATADQRRLLPEEVRRDIDAANRALARLRAECGEQNVVRAAIRDAHLPSARFAWEPLTHVPAQSSPRVMTVRPLVRRIYVQPAVCSSSTVAASQLRRGPFVVSGGWWGGGVRRDYYFVHTAEGELWWVYFDHRRRQFFLQGRVE